MLNQWVKRKIRSCFDKLSTNGFYAFQLPFSGSLGNKRTAFTITELFLALNGQELIADDPSCVVTMLKLAEGSLSEKELADWIRNNIEPN